ncbi:MAG: DNA-(apurinic or apyrimidinic site) lyase [Saprospiraceae bacterium]|nr:DNA-(apurinic or apyrimidinic site) lyase [Saprospiraceae bacterium]
MPELPEVNTVRNNFHLTVLHLNIIEVAVHDDVILRNSSPKQFKQTLDGRRFVDTYRQGKYFFGILDNGIHILFHLGMTGDLIYYFTRDDQPKYERFRIQFSDGMILGYNDPRKFSNILVIQNLPIYLQEIKLGPDALVISQEEFEAMFANRKTSLKALLMNQQLIAGIGNLYADEICYQAKIHPASSAGALSRRHLNVLYKLMREILQEACDREAYYQIYPDNWFWKWRSDDTKVLKGKGSVGKMKIAGRTTYFVEGYQKLIV